MLLSSNFILNMVDKKESLNIQPYIHTFSNTFKESDPFKVCKIPDINPLEHIKPGHDFSMVAGEFVEVYNKRPGEWDSVITCFFIDTANNVIEYITTIYNILKPGGVWINFGPLLYHYADMIEEKSIELSWEEIRHITEKIGFIITVFIIYYLLFIIYYLLFIIYYLLFIIYYLLFIIYYLLFIIYYLLFIIYYLLFIIYYLLFIIYYLLFIIYYLLFIIYYLLFIIYYLLFIIYYLLFIIYYLLFIIYYLLFIIYYLLFIIYYLLFIIYYLLFIIYYLLFIIYYLLFIIYYLLFIARTS